MTKSLLPALLVPTEVPCPVCNAARGYACTKNDGMPAPWRHVKRWEVMWLVNEVAEELTE